MEASGVHVKSFGPGEITADECVLVMTSEAVLAGLRLSALESLKGTAGTKGTESRDTPPLDAIPKHLGADAAIWNVIKAGGVKESSAVESKAAPEQRRSVSAVVPPPGNLGFVASQAGVRALTASQLSQAPGNGSSGSGNNAAALGLPVPSERKAIGRRGQAAAFPSKQNHLSKGSRPANERTKRLWQPVAMVAALSIFAVVLLAGRPSILSSPDVAAVGNRNPGARSDPGAASVIDRGSKARSSTRVSNLAPEGQRHISDYDFVAEDYTTHFDLRARPGAAAQAPDLRHGAPNRPVRKRVVVD